MAISGINGNGSQVDQAKEAAASGPLTSGATGNQPMGKDAFLKLLVAQIRHQDPLKPMADTEFVAQLATFSGLEQQMTSNKLLELVATQQQGQANQGGIALVGKSVTVKGGTLSLAEGGFGAPVRYSLGSNAQEVTINIKDQTGNTVRTIEVGPKPAGASTLLWDGNNQTGTQQLPGAYSVSVTAKDADGNSIDVSQETSGIVKEVSFENGYSKVVLENGVTAPASELLRVGMAPVAGK
jgi:flagellar basal-body rod modification protein FlgD